MSIERQGASGSAFAMAGFLPNLRRYAMIGLPIVLAFTVIGLLWFRGQYEEEKAARVADRAAEQAKVLEVEQREAIAIGSSGKKAGSYVSQIRAAPDADRRRLGSRGVRTSSRVVAVDRQPSAALQLPCEEAELVPDPETASDDQVQVERVNVACPYVDCRQRHAHLVTFVRDRRRVRV